MSDWYLWDYTKSGFENIRSEIAGVAASVQAGNERHSKAVRNLKSELESMRGDVEDRLDALTNSFIAFVELDGIRKQLESFPEQSAARRHAREDVATLLAGQVPPSRDDVPGYWLVPAVKALSPDGAVDRVQAALAQQREMHQATMFLAVAQAALGAGPAAMEDVDDVLVPNEAATWDESQLILWLVTLRGAFGNQALATLDGILRPAVQQVDDWASWAQLASGEESEFAGVTWATKQIEDLAPPSEPSGAAQDSRPVALPNYSREAGARRRLWAVSSRRIDPLAQDENMADGFEQRPDAPGPDFTAPDQQLTGTSENPASDPLGSDVVPPGNEASEGDDSIGQDTDAEPGEPPLSQEEEKQATHAMLVKILNVLIGRGTKPEQALLARAAVLEEQFTNPRGAIALPDDVPEERHPVVEVLRRSAMDEKVTRADRFWIWHLIGEALLPTAHQYVSESSPPVPVEDVRGVPGVTANPDGVVDGARLRKAQQSLDDQAPSGIRAQGWWIMGVALTVAILSLSFAPTYPVLWWPTLGGVAAAIWGCEMAMAARDLRASLAEGRERINAAVKQAIAVATQRHITEQQEHEQRRQAGQELIAVMERLRRI